MNGKRLLARPWLALCLAGGVLLAAAAAHAQTCVTSECHATLLAKRHVHPATDSCGDCHEAVATPHPQAGVKTFKLAAQPPELCTNCHESFGAKKTVHEPVAGGECTTCHDPHAADQARLLVQPLGELCANCHSEPAAAAHPHAPVAAGECTACHSPHESDRAKLLRASENDLCLGCHGAIVTKAMTTVHAPVEDGCTTCHEPHGGARAKLLKNDFPVRPYEPYTDSSYALCFDCHDRDLVARAQTSTATGFRDGDRNLHAVHVGNPQKGRSCALCHDLHGGSSPLLVAASVPFGKWTLPIRFVPTATGGGCSPGCHRPLGYDREKAARKK